jgi:BCS1 N terminal
MSDEDRMLDYLAPVLTTLIIGSIVSGVYFILNFLKNKIEEKFTASITIDNSDMLYKMVLDYLIDHKYLNQGMNNLECKTERSENKTYWGYSTGDLNTDLEKPKINYNPGLGNFFFFGK